MQDDCKKAWLAEISDIQKLDKDEPLSLDDEIEDLSSLTKVIPQDEPVMERVVFRPPAKPHKPLMVVQNTANCLKGWGQGLDERMIRRLARGEIAFEDRIDLHGFYEQQAWMACADFLHEAADNGLRCVLMIHGKGKGFGACGGMGVIKSQMAEWLSHHSRVLAFHTAVPRDGGAGAVYVYLKRNK